MRKVRLIPFLLLFICVIGIDQYTKVLALSHIGHGEIIPVAEGFFNLTLVYNTGVAFGLFSGIADEVRTWVIGGVAAFALIIVLTFVGRHYRESNWALSALTLIVGGAIGNLIDRVRLGKVVDFLDFFIGDWHWPAFNAADSFICIGVALLLLLPEKPKDTASP